MQTLDYVVIGGGIVGLATAAALRPFGSVAVLEQHPRLIHETSSRNSGVIHAGIYYPENSLKTQLCLKGNANIWRWQGRSPERIRARKVGKWIGTSDGPEGEAESSVLEGLVANMDARGIPYEMVSKDQQRREEPLVRMGTVVNSLGTGIVDVTSLRDALVDIIQSEGAGDAVPSAGDGADLAGFVAPCSRVTRIDVSDATFDKTAGGDSGIRLTVQQTESRDPDDVFELCVKRAVVAAVGLHGNTFWDALRMNQTNRVQQPPNHLLSFCKGRYVSYNSGTHAPVQRLVYPCPLPNLVGLGVHSTVDMGGVVRFGPDALYTSRFDDYSFSDGTADTEQDAAAAMERFLDSQFEAVRRYVPSIERRRMTVDYVGVRPKLAGPGEGFRDFLFEEVVGVKASDTASGTSAVPVMKTVKVGSDSADDDRGDLPRLIIATGIESPGLTASTAIGEALCQCILGDPARYQSALPPWA